MSTTYPTHDSLRIPPKPRLAQARHSGRQAAPGLLFQVTSSAIAAFGLAWMLSAFLIG